MPVPIRIMEVGFGFFGSKVLLTAVRDGVFSELAAGPRTAIELGRALGYHPRGVYDFFDALVALGFLERIGNGEAALYRNTPDSATFLDRRGPDYIGGILEMMNDRHYRFWADLGEALRTGQPQNEIKRTGASVFAELYSDPARLEQFVRAMSAISRDSFEALAQGFDFSRYSTMCDVGGAGGDLAIAIARRHPGIRLTSLDLPVIEPIARAAIERAGLGERIATAAGDFFKGPLPRAQVITMAQVLHDWNLENKQRLIRAAYEALPEGGAFIAIDHLIDDDRRTNAFGLFMSLHMMIEFGDAFDYTAADFGAWCSEVGFERFEVLRLAGPASAAIAYK